MKKIIIRIIIASIAFIVVVLGVFILNGKKMYDDIIAKTSLTETVRNIQDSKNYVRINELPNDYINAVIAVEDHRYKNHGAVDLIAIGRAIITNINYREYREGGSTITQQVAKNLFLITEEDSATRKIAEAFSAIDLENNYSKDDILELYVNIIYFGDGYYGIKQACKGYLNKKPSEMTLSDCTMMAGIPNAPSVYAPTVNPDLTKSRQKKVISDMVEYEYLSKEEADKLLNEID